MKRGGWVEAHAEGVVEWNSWSYGVSKLGFKHQLCEPGQITCCLWVPTGMRHLPCGPEAMHTKDPKHNEWHTYRLILCLLLLLPGGQDPRPRQLTVFRQERQPRFCNCVRGLSPTGSGLSSRQTEREAQDRGFWTPLKGQLHAIQPGHQAQAETWSRGPALLQIGHKTLAEPCPFSGPQSPHL